MSCITTHGIWQSGRPSRGMAVVAMRITAGDRQTLKIIGKNNSFLESHFIQPLLHNYRNSGRTEILTRTGIEIRVGTNGGDEDGGGDQDKDGDEDDDGNED